jgi:hypothetical protein
VPESVDADSDNQVDGGASHGDVDDFLGDRGRDWGSAGAEALELELDGFPYVLKRFVSR